MCDEFKWSDFFTKEDLLSAKTFFDTVCIFSGDIILPKSLKFC